MAVAAVAVVASGLGGRLRLSWLSLDYKPLYLPDLVRASLNPSLLKGRRKTESPCCSIHPRLISTFSFLVPLIYSPSLTLTLTLASHSLFLFTAAMLNVTLYPGQSAGCPLSFSLSLFFSFLISHFSSSVSFLLSRSLTLTLTLRLFFPLLLLPAQTVTVTQPTLQ